ncbi:melanoregulin [Trichomycterus rosablanca]|uniref:melanoregulin n=1 Tax=Trichomycterus rosablanca TaxID=2290929 RepID=UPI002F35D937
MLGPSRPPLLLVPPSPLLVPPLSSPQWWSAGRRVRMGAAFRRFCARFCCCCCVRDDEDEDEKRPIFSNETLQYFDREAKKRRDQETNLWNEPGDPSHSERDDDRALYNLLQNRSRTHRGSQGYRRLSVDIEAMREVRREVRDKWKMILENLGFMEGAESLLAVNASASYDRIRNAAAARTLLQTLHSETSIFNSGEPPPERYLFTLDRLIYLDAADEFVMKARRFYPPREEDEDEEDQGSTLPLLLSRVNQHLSAGEDEDEEEETSKQDE